MKRESGKFVFDIGLLVLAFTLVLTNAFVVYLFFNYSNNLQYSAKAIKKFDLSTPETDFATDLSTTTRKKTTFQGFPGDLPVSNSFYYYAQGKEKKLGGINFLFFGDLMVDRHVKEKIDKHGFDYLFANIAGEDKRFFRGVDIISANLEGAVTDDGKHYKPQMSYDFAFAPEIIAKFNAYNFNFFNLANNHFADQGEQGIIETRQNLDSLGMAYSGCKDKKVGDCSVKIINVGGLRIGMAGFSMVYGTFNESEAAELIKKLASTTDKIIVNIHWGVEYKHKFNTTQQRVAHGLIDAGADIIIGHHPHVVEGMEVYRGKPIFYSLGNFIFDQYFSVDTQEELAVGINLADEQETIFLFPLKSESSQLELMKDKSKKVFLEKFVDWSALDSNLVSQAKEGIIIF